MQYFYADLPTDVSYETLGRNKAATFRLLTHSDMKSLQSYGVRAYFPPRSEPIYAPQRRSLPFPAAGPSPGDLEAMNFTNESLYDLFVPETNIPGLDEYQISPSPYSPSGSSFSEPEAPQDPLTPSEEFDPDYFESLLGMTDQDQTSVDDSISSILQQLISPITTASTPSPPETPQTKGTSTLARILTETRPCLPKVTPTSTPKAKRGARRVMKDIDILPPQLGASGSASLWEFILELLSDSTYEPYIRWTDHSKGQFKIYDSQVVAALWGKHKNHVGMNFDKMSRAMRYYYGKNILEKGDQGGRLEYQFQEGSQWLSYISRNLNRRNFSAPNPNQYCTTGLDGGQPIRVSRRRSSQRNRGGTSPY